MFGSPSEVAALVVSVLTALGLLAGLSETRRLRRRADLLKEAAAGLPEGAPQRPAIANHYTATVARLLARQLFGVWRYVWPWIPVMAIAYMGYDLSYRGVMYAHKYNGFSYDTFVIDVLGTPDLAIMLPFVVLIFAPIAVQLFVGACVNRAAAAVEFYESGTLRLRPLQDQKPVPSANAEPPKVDTFSRAGIASGIRMVKQGIGAWWLLVSPILFFYASASLIGSFVAAHRTGDSNFALTDAFVRYFNLGLIVLLAVTIISFLNLGMEVNKELRRLRAFLEYLPSTTSEPERPQGDTPSLRVVGRSPISARSARAWTLGAGVAFTAFVIGKKATSIHELARRKS